MSFASRTTQISDTAQIMQSIYITTASLYNPRRCYCDYTHSIINFHAVFRRKANESVAEMRSFMWPEIRVTYRSTDVSEQGARRQENSARLSWTQKYTLALLTSLPIYGFELCIFSPERERPGIPESRIRGNLTDQDLERFI